MAYSKKRKEAFVDEWDNASKTMMDSYVNNLISAFNRGSLRGKRDNLLRGGNYHKANSAMRNYLDHFYTMLYNFGSPSLKSLRESEKKVIDETIKNIKSKSDKRWKFFEFYTLRLDVMQQQLLGYKNVFKSSEYSSLRDILDKAFRALEELEVSETFGEVDIFMGRLTKAVNLFNKTFASFADNRLRLIDKKYIV